MDFNEGGITMSINWETTFSEAFSYTDYLARHGTDAHRDRWQGVYDKVRLTDEQQALLRGFERDMNVLAVSGTWCGDCANQLPILRRFEEAAPRLELRFLERDEVPDMSDSVQ